MVTDSTREDFFPIAVWYSGGKARAPMLSKIGPNSRTEWLADLRQIADLGFNAVRTWVAWADCEPREGELHFENLTLLCELAEEVGLRVLLQVYAEATPLWFSRRHSNAAFISQSGERLESQVAPGVCSDHAPVRDGILNFYRETARVVTRFPSFFGWDLWSEPHIVNWTIVSHAQRVEFCHCAHTRARFREWLQAKYTTLDALCESWNRSFEGWDSVEPPRFGTILTYTDFLDWKQFIFEKMASDLRMRAEAVREVDPDHVITSHAAVPSGLTSPMSEWAGYGATDDFLMADTVDHYGLSLYPKHSHPSHHWERWKIDYALDFSHSANAASGGFYVGELQAGPGARGVVVGDPIEAADHRRWIWTAIARGAKAVCIYAYHPMTSGYEAGGYGLIGHDGSITERAEASGQIARVISENQDLFLRSRPAPAEVAIVYNPLAQLAGGEQSSGPTSLHPDSLIGYHRVFADQTIPTDFIHRRDLESGDLSRYRLIVVPHPLMLTQSAADGLRRFVECGGSALSEARLAWCDDRGFTSGAIPGLGLDEVFGAREGWVRMDESPEIRIADCGHPALRGLTPGTILQGGHFAEALCPLPDRETQVLAHFDDGSPAVLASSFGAGKTLLVGTFLGLANRNCWSENIAKLVLGVAEWAGVSRMVTTSQAELIDPPVAVHHHRTPQGHLLFLINHSDDAQQITVQLKIDPGKSLSVRDIASNAPVPHSMAGGVVTVGTSVVAGNAVVLDISKR